MDCQDLKTRVSRLKSERASVEDTFQALERFIMPFSGDFTDPTSTEHEVDWRYRHLYDSTAVIANQNLAANIHSGVTSPVYQWFDFMFFDEELNRDQEAIVWLTECSRRVFSALQQSNFNLEVNNVYLDLTAFGTGILVEEVEERADGSLDAIDFMGVPLAECYFEDDSDGQLVFFFRELEWTATQVVEKFGDDTPEDIREAYDNNVVDRRYSFIFAVYPREDKKDADPWKPLAKKERPYGSKYFRFEDAEMVGEEDGYYEMPAFIPRWRRTTGSKWGHSPGMICLSDVLTLNALVELTLKSAEKAVDPPILTTRRGVFGDVNLEASGITMVASMESLQPFNSGARFDVSALNVERLQQSINRTYFVDQLQLKESPAMTATEVQVRYEMMQRLMGPTLNQLQYDFLDPLVKRTFRILYRYRMLPEAPEIVKGSGAETRVEYTGPMARAQKADTVASIERWMGTLGQMAEVYPELLDLPDVDKAGRYLGNAGGVPPDVIKTEAKVEQQRRERAAQRGKQQKLGDATQVSEIVKNMGGADGLQAAGAGGGVEGAIATGT